MISGLEAIEAKNTSCFLAAEGKMVQSLNTEHVELGPAQPQTELFLI